MAAIRAGLTAGAIAAIIAALVSLPLHSPLDSAFNSATVLAATLLTGLLAGALWRSYDTRPAFYGGLLAAAFVVAAVLLGVGNIWLERLASFGIPLAAIAFGVSGVVTPSLARIDSVRRQWLALAVAGPVALVIGLGLVTQGDAASGELALPERPSPAAVAPTAPPPTATAIVTPPAAAATPQSAAATTPPPTDTAPRPSATATRAAPSPTAPPTAESTPTDAGPSSAAAFTVGPDSRATFTVEESLTASPVRFDAVIESDDLSGEVYLDGMPSVVTLDLHSLESDQDFRDGYIRRRMFPNTPQAVFTVAALPDIPDGFYQGETITRAVAGTLRIGETETPLDFEVEARHDGDVLNLLGRTSFTWEQLQLEKPTARSVTYLADEVFVQVLLIAPAQ